MCVCTISLVVLDDDALELVASFFAHAEVAVDSVACLRELSAHLTLAVLPGDVVAAGVG